DDAMKAGFGWQMGPFEIWDAIGLEKGIELIKQAGKEPAEWVKDMSANGVKSFYEVRDGNTYYFAPPLGMPAGKEGLFIKKPGQDSLIILDNIRKSSAVFQNSGVVLEDLGDGI